MALIPGLTPQGHLVLVPADGVQKIGK